VIHLQRNGKIICVTFLRVKPVFLFLVELRTGERSTYPVAHELHVMGTHADAHYLCFVRNEVRVLRRLVVGT
jgi:hypothetical protein